MSWIDRAEARFGHLAIPNLLRIIAGFSALVFVLYKLNPGWLDTLWLDPAAVKRGEVWRLVTYVFIPQIGGQVFDWLFALLYVWYIWWLGEGLEEAMGSFKLNLFYLLGMLGTTVAAFFFGAGFSTFMLNSSLFFAFARFFPEMVIYFMMILPLKVKWLAWIYGALLLFGFLTSPLAYKFAVVAAFSNYLVFFGREIFQAAALRREVSTRRRRFEEATSVDAGLAMHRCEVCGRTEIDEPHLDFRVSRDGHEYCVDHLPGVNPKAQEPDSK
jgi:hypothetical protein